MKLTTFHTVAGRYARVLGRTAHVRVTFSGTGAYIQKRSDTDHRLNIPAMPAGTVMTTHQADVFRGLLDHEIGHLRWTDLDLIRNMPELAPVKRGGKGGKVALNPEYDPTLAWLWNVIEDVWQETVTIEDLPGTRPFLDICTHYVVAEGRKLADARTAGGKPSTWEDTVLSAIYREAYGLRGIDVDVGTDATLEEADLAEVQDLLDARIPLLNDTKGCLQLAREIKALLAQASDDFKTAAEKGGEPGEGKPGEGKPGEGKPGEGKPGEGQMFPGGPGDLDESAERMMDWIVDMALNSLLRDVRNLNAKESGGKGGGKGEAISTLPGQGGEPGEGDEGAGTPNVADTPNVPIDDKLDPKNRGGSHQAMEQWHTFLPPAGTDRDKIFVPSDEDHAQYVSERAALAAHIAAAKKALNTFLRSRTSTSWSRGLDEGDVDDDMLADHVALGDERIRKARRSRTITAADLVLMLDLSGSMSAELVRQAAITIAEALNDVRPVKLKIGGFYTGSHDYGDFAGCGRRVALRIPLFKDFDEPYRRVVGRLGGIGTGGYTPLGEGMANAYESLVVRDTRRRILWMVSDGSPYYPTCTSASGVHSDEALLRDVHAKCRRQGIETLALGIGSDNMEPFVDRYEGIRSVDQMTQAIIRLTKLVLVP